MEHTIESNFVIIWRINTSSFFIIYCFMTRSEPKEKVRHFFRNRVHECKFDGFYDRDLWASFNGNSFHRFYRSME